MPPHPEAQLYRCKRCTHAFTAPESILAPEQYGAAYFDEDHKRWFDHPNVKHFRLILEGIPFGAAVLDVGCGRGDFLCFAHAERPDLTLTGLDLSENVSKPEIRFLCGDLLTMQIEERFDAVVSLAVIEHVAPVQAYVDRMRQFAKPGGMLVIMTINDGSLLYAAGRLGRSLGVPLAFNRLYSIHHLHHFTRSSLSAVLSRNGCVVRKHYDHNAPIQAMDIPVRSRSLDFVLRTGLRALWIAGRVTCRSYQQTVVCGVA
jgi:SAM-dependent methyltransferase